MFLLRKPAVIVDAMRDMHSKRNAPFESELSSSLYSVFGKPGATFMRADSPDYETPPESEECESSGTFGKEVFISTKPSSEFLLEDSFSDDMDMEDSLLNDFEESTVSDEDDDEEHAGWQEIGALKLINILSKQHDQRTTESNPISYLDEKNFRKASAYDPQVAGSSGGDGGSGDDKNPPGGNGKQSAEERAMTEESSSGIEDSSSPSDAEESPPNRVPGSSDSDNDDHLRNPPQNRDDAAGNSPPVIPEFVPIPNNENLMPNLEPPEQAVVLFLHVICELANQLIRRIENHLRQMHIDPQVRQNAFQVVHDIRANLPQGDHYAQLGPFVGQAFQILQRLDEAEALINRIVGNMRPAQVDTSSENRRPQRSDSPDEPQFEIDETTRSSPPNKRRRDENDENRGGGGGQTSF